MKHFVELSDGIVVPALGMGTWYLGESPEVFEQEKEALTAGIEAGMTLIDTAEMYGEGLSELLIGETIRTMDRSKLFLVSKVYPHHAGKRDIFSACDNTLKRLGTDYLDLYLLHWRGRVPLQETVDCMERLKAEGKIRNWGVSNFDTADMQELWQTDGGRECRVNQVLYHVASRGIEYDLLPWMREHQVALMAYCPMAQAAELKRGLLEHPVLKQIAEAHHTGVMQVMAAWTMRDGHTITIPRSGKKVHVLQNVKADEIEFTEEELRMIDNAFPAPKRKTYLEMV